MTSHQPPGPQPRTAAGNGVDAETIHLGVTAPGRAPAPPRRTAATAPSPYPARPAFRAPAPPPQEPAPAPAPSRPAPRPAWEGIGFRPDIQGLRAIAVILVLLSHAGFGFAAGGYVGVDVFFVLSGFLITSLLIKEAFGTGKISLGGFYARRARRILPAASLVTIATVLGAWLWFPVTRLEAVMQDAFTVIVYAVNYRLIAEETEYLNADQMPTPFQQFWSLAVEEQFYLVWPLLLIGLMFLAGRSPRKLVSTGLAACAAIFAISLILSVFVTEQSQPTAYYAAHTRAWELAAGAILALTLPTWRKTPKALAWILGIAGLAMVVAAGVMYTEDTAFPGYTALLPVAGTMLVLIAGSTRSGHPVGSLLSTGPFQFFGKISYSLYLWHWPILILIPLAVDAEPTVGLNVVLLIAAVGIAQLTYQYVEEPLRKSRSIQASNMWGLVTGVVCSVLCIAMVVMMTVGFAKVPPEDEPPVDLEAVEEAEDLSEIEMRLQEGLSVTSTPDDLEPSLTSAGADTPAIYGDDCHLDSETVEPPSECAYGDTESGTVVVLMGDSHAAQWFPALEPLAEAQGWKLLSRTKSSCGPADITPYNSILEREYTECDQWRDSVISEIEEIEPAMVILSGEDSPSLADGEDSSPEAWAEAWTSTLGRITAAAGQTVTLTDTPRSPTGDSIPECISIHQDEVQECVLDRAEAVDDSGNREAAMGVAQESGATVIDTVGWFCISGQCPVITGSTLIYRDSHHMSTPYSRSLSTLLGDALPKL
ncbi:acyltransferase family protein [Glycomyces algeriensis]|uniref:Acyltransferase n=1 Tax=Glycomyces algeriensis TaxID=256037 RepID=A0A9W6LFW5_9ACTN|nr:acyltransferase family protein [Glycomyces algeriensis]MDA1368155.1 acyltransferase family protein [Glycomyces algeriensis]MDR7348862.1 peptidoglycan/LPS O-acetylase OafA/YrhL [Glycomyces algeriensis]GLI41565.1 acyltransferase [Glycomyces algeriensis]